MGGTRSSWCAVLRILLCFNMTDLLLTALENMQLHA